MSGRDESLDRIKRAWASSMASRTTDHDDWLISLLTNDEVDSLAERAEDWARANPEPDGHCRWKGHDYWGPGYSVGTWDVCASCEPAARAYWEGER